MGKIRVAAVKYINSYPFMIGLKQGKVSSIIDVSVCHPSECAARVINGEADIGLVPVAAIASMNEYYIISDFCLSTQGEVKTVLLVSNTSFDKINKIFLDFRSRSSVALCRILAAKSWNRTFMWSDTDEDFDVTAMGQGEAAVMIGDRCFRYARLFNHRIDLGLEWKKFTGLPFVFACWVSAKPLESAFVELFTEALKEGISRKDEAVKLLSEESVARPEEVIDYLHNNIDFHLDDTKRKAISLFIEYVKELKLNQ